jgi:group I intron endonuclease
MIVYKATCSITNKCYIGQTIYDLNSRIAGHISDMIHKNSCHFHHALNKHGLMNFAWSILQECSSIEDLNEYEEWWIDVHDSFKNGYNMTTGGGNCQLSKEHKEKISKALKGIPGTWLGRQLSKEHKENIGKAVSGKNNGNYNRQFSEEHKRKISKSKLGKKLTVEHKEKIGAAVRCRVITSETKNKMSISAKIRKQNIFVCPHCNKAGKGNVMFYHHFDNCKMKATE